MPDESSSSTAAASPPEQEDESDARRCTFNPVANRYEWWETGVGFTGEPCVPVKAGGTDSGED